jgi:DNA-binding winged helix-turn-helix (wHTH) protein
MSKVHRMASQPFEQDTALLPKTRVTRADARPPRLALVAAAALSADRLPTLPVLSTGTAISFGRFRLLPDRRHLLADGQPVALGSRAFDVLLALVFQRQRVVSQGELMRGVWPGQVVESNTLQVHVSALRKLLGNGAVSTVSRRGYRFTAQVDGDFVAEVSAAQPDLAVAANPCADTGLAQALAVYLFDGLEVHPGAGLVLIKGRVEILRPQAMALLMALVDRRQRSVGKIELMRLVWPGKAMAENNLQVQIAALRKLLGPSVIATIPGQGYLFNMRPRELAATPSLAAGLRPSAATAGPAGTLRRPGLLPSERAALSLLSRAIEITVADELATEALGRPNDRALLQRAAGQTGRLVRARTAAARCPPGLATDPAELGDALVHLGAALVGLGKRDQALVCLRAAATLWLRAHACQPAT